MGTRWEALELCPCVKPPPLIFKAIYHPKEAGAAIRSILVALFQFCKRELGKSNRRTQAEVVWGGREGTELGKERCLEAAGLHEASFPWGRKASRVKSSGFKGFHLGLQHYKTFWRDPDYRGICYHWEFWGWRGGTLHCGSGERLPCKPSFYSHFPCLPHWSGSTCRSHFWMFWINSIFKSKNSVGSPTVDL